MTSKKGNEIKKKGTEEDPAVVIERSGVSLLFIPCQLWLMEQNNVVKRAHELNEVESDD